VERGEEEQYDEEECLQPALGLFLNDSHHSNSEVQFQYEFDHYDWRSFDPAQNAILEEAVNNGLPGTRVQIGQHVYEIRFQDGVQRNLQTGTVRRVRWRWLGSSQWLPASEEEENHGQLQCQACTFLNPSDVSACSMCGSVLTDSSHAEQEEEAGMYLTRPSDASFVLGGAALGAAFGGLISYSRRQDITTGLLQGASAGIIGGSLAQAAAMTLTESARHRSYSSSSSSSSRRVDTSAIPTHRLTGDDHVKLGECVICLSNFARGEEIKRLPCLHSFHGSCIDRWLSKGSHACPICKTDISNFSMG